MAHKNKKKPVQPLLSPNKLIKERGRTYPIVECYINRNWKKEGLAQIVIIRKMGGDKFLLGSYIVDTFCLGLKDCFAKIMDEYELEKYKAEAPFVEIECDADLAQNIIYGAIEYAEDLGFKPHTDFNVAQYVLNDVDDIEYIEIEFGKNGKPFYIQGPYDKPLHILATLDKNVGEGNYYYRDERYFEDYDDLDEEDEEEDDALLFEEEAQGLKGEDRLEFSFAFSTAKLMDELEYEYGLDFEYIDLKIRMEALEELKDVFLTDMMKGLSEESKENLKNHDKEEPLLNILTNFTSSLLEQTKKFEAFFKKTPDSFRQVATLFYAQLVKMAYENEESEQSKEEDDGYTAFEEVK